MADVRNPTAVSHPVPSPALRWGLGLVVLSGLAFIAAGGVFLRTELAPARVGGLVLFLAAAGCAGTIATILLRVQTTRYVLGPNALEIRSALGRRRIRYEQIRGASMGAPDPPIAPIAWPGAHIGCVDAARQHAEWHATSVDPRRVIWIEWEGGAYAVSPVDPAAFGRRLEELVAANAHLPAGAPAGRCGMIGRIVQLDPWFRLLVLLGLAFGSFVAFVQVSVSGSVYPGSLVAIVALVVNAALGAAVARYSSGAARVLAAGGLATVFVASLW